MNRVEHVKNRNAFPFEVLEKYEGQHVAWSLDGARILAGHEGPRATVRGAGCGRLSAGRLRPVVRLF